MALLSADVAFICTAGPEVGFGHLRRCVMLGRQLYTHGLRVSVAGKLDAAAIRLLQRELPDAETAKPVSASLAVIDCMFDPQDPDYYDRDFILEVTSNYPCTALVTSGVEAPADLPVDLVIGHMLDPIDHPRYELHRGLAWAPVDPAAASFREAQRDYPHNPRRMLLSFGNWQDTPTGLLLALEATTFAGIDADIQVLLPPALQPFEAEIRRCGRHLRLEIIAAVPSVLPLLRECDLLVGSYGNLTFEALALGVPVVIIAIKDFMARYAGRLAAQDCLVCAGTVGKLEPRALADELRRLCASRRRRLGSTGWRLVDGAGLQRAARLLWRRAGRCEASLVTDTTIRAMTADLGITSNERIGGSDSTSS